MKKKLKSKTKSQNAGTRSVDELPTRPVSDVTGNGSFVLYGQSGTGKTTIAATFPGPVLIADIKDRGTDSVSDAEDCEVMEVESWDDFEMIYWFLKNKKNRGKYNTLVIDTVSQLQQLAVLKILESKKKSTDRAGDWGTMTKKDWGDVSSMMKEWITNLRDLRGIKIVFIAQHRVFNVGDDTDEEEMLQPEVGPRLSPSIAAHLNAEAYLVGNTFIKMKTVIEKDQKGRRREKQKPIYCLRVGPNPIYVTKVRKPKSIILPDVIVDPTYEKIMSSLKETRNGKKKQR